jgi:hypothetical protein
MNSAYNRNHSSTDNPSKSTGSNVRLYKGRHYYKPNSKLHKYIPNLTKVYDAKWMPIIPKVVVFDLDETIGCFSDLYLIWTAIFNTEIYKGPTNPHIVQSIFNELLDLYPEFLRYGILHILDFIRTKIQNGESHCIYLYTNNQCDFVACPDSRYNKPPSPTEWVEMIIVYLNMKIGATNTIFAKPICAFKIGSRIIEPLRESRRKTHSDLLKFAVLPKNTEICFVDDAYHPQMVHNRVYYVQPPPYVHELSQTAIIDRFMVSALYTKLNNLHYGDCWFESANRSTITNLPVSTGLCPRNDARSFVGELDCSRTKRSSDDDRSFVGELSRIEHNKEVYHKMMYYIKEFFCISAKKQPTRKRQPRIGKFTRKKKS